MRGTLAFAVIGALALAGCATTPPVAPIHTSLVLWAKGDDARCGFEAPVREGSHATGYSPTARATADRGRLAPVQRYSVRNAQMQVRPVEGERFCLLVSRGQATDAVDAAFGFEVVAVTPGELEVRPVSARISRAAIAGVSTDAVRVSVGLATGPYRPDGVDVVSSAVFDLGLVPTDGRTVERHAAPRRLSWPEASGRFDILRIGAHVIEARPDAAEAVVREQDLREALTPGLPSLR
ncbi:MAG: hypothetical protein IBJ02_02485 [Brevundimonas sp.]|nr:hypothetical protein [Brevundimonas sp.]